MWQGCTYSRRRRAGSEEPPLTVWLRAWKPSRTFGLGEGLIGQCAQDRASVSLTGLPPDYLRIASGLGTATPERIFASPLLSKDTLLGVVEVATFRSFDSRQQALIGELLPLVAMSLEILQRNLRTQELLGQTQASGAATD